MAGGGGEKGQRGKAKIGRKGRSKGPLSHSLSARSCALAIRDPRPRPTFRRILHRWRAAPDDLTVERTHANQGSSHPAGIDPSAGCGSVGDARSARANTNDDNLVASLRFPQFAVDRSEINKSLETMISQKRRSGWEQGDEGIALHATVSLLRV